MLTGQDTLLKVRYNNVTVVSPSSILYDSRLLWRALKETIVLTSCPLPTLLIIDSLNDLGRELMKN